MNHAELMLLWAAMIVAFFPMSDVLSIRRPRPSSPDTDARSRAAVLAVTILFAASYFSVAVVRLWKGVTLFKADTLRSLVADHWAQTGVIDGGVYRLPHGTPIFEVLPAWSFRLFYVGATLLELLVPLVLVSKWARRVVPPGLLAFHAMNILWLDIPFIEDMLMLVVFSDVWFPGCGRYLARLEARARPERAPTFSLALGNPENGRRDRD